MGFPDRGPPGAAGSQWLSGAGVPAAGLGNNGDNYLRTSNGAVYGKAAGAWALLLNITGPAGAAGSSEGALVGLAADATLTADNTYRTIAWTAEAYDDSAYHAVNATGFVIPAGKGGAGTRFRVDALLNYNASVGGGIIQWLLRQNGNRTTGGYDGPPGQTSDTQQVMMLSYVWDAPADGDTLDVVYAKNGTNTTLASVYDAGFASWLAIAKVK